MGSLFVEVMTRRIYDPEEGTPQGDPDGKGRVLRFTGGNQGLVWGDQRQGSTLSPSCDLILDSWSMTQNLMSGRHPGSQVVSKTSESNDRPIVGISGSEGWCSSPSRLWDLTKKNPKDVNFRRPFENCRVKGLVRGFG